MIADCTDYPDAIHFRESARAHMRAWMRDVRGEEPAHPNSVVFVHESARTGGNFVNDQAFAVARLRYPAQFKNDSRPGRRSVAADALCSAHVPFNLFGPLVHCLSPVQAGAVLRRLTDCPIERLETVAFEQPSRRENPLRDNTAHDAMLTCRSANGPVHVGVEVKFTEGPYSSTTDDERKGMKAPDGKYVVLSAASGLFLDGAWESMGNPHLKQLWRNMLLTHEMANRRHATYVYVHVYPMGNAYQRSVTVCFGSKILRSSAFRPITYESYFDALAEYEGARSWVDALRQRYLVGGHPSARVRAPQTPRLNA